MDETKPPYECLLKMYFVERREGFCKIGMAYRKELTNPHGNFHGGAIASIIDTAAVQGLRTIAPFGPYPTVDLAVRFKNPGRSSEIFAEARPRHLKGKFFETKVRVLDKENKLVAEAQVKSFLPNWNNKEAQSQKK
jgi:acyl-CoA thioesterase